MQDNASEQFMECKRAYETLSDASERRLHDRQLSINKVRGFILPGTAVNLVTSGHSDVYSGCVGLACSQCNKASP